MSDKRYVTCGVRVLIFNDKDELLLGRRIEHKNRLYAAPGGHLEFGESFEECAARELKEELDLDIDPAEIKYFTTLNVIKKEESFHYLNIMTVLFIDQAKANTIKNLDKHYCLEWEWLEWGQVLQSKELYHTFYSLFESGYTDIN